METTTLNNGVEMPALGLGVFQTITASRCPRSVWACFRPHRMRRAMRSGRNSIRATA